MKFKINNTEWTIKEVTEAEINNEMKNDYTMGVTIYKTQEILLLKDQANLIKTLKHELVHVWLYEYGHAQNDDKKYDYEDICEIVASSNDFINEVIEQYKNKDIVFSKIDLERMHRQPAQIIERRKLMENDDLIVYNKETKEVIAIIPIISGNRPAVFKKGYDSIIKNCNEKHLIGDGKNIYLKED